MSNATITKRKLGIRVIQWIILGMLLVPPISFFEGGDGGNWDGIYSSGSFGEIGYPYRWMFYTAQGSHNYSVRYNIANFVLDGLVFTLLSPFILEPARFILKKLRLRENASKYYQQKNY